MEAVTDALIVIQHVQIHLQVVDALVAALTVQVVAVLIVLEPV